ncbi:hypothetical protein Goshw_016955 [Gossypium schwendimanii]|uniref:Uncharacterized protein n=1 Tax=Gossypium schwendimanii TaxID=34291 RepID=A0A7J9KSY2_GOSSC|nr:hypothetical protein [Gossypium schwendimanii]
MESTECEGGNEGDLVNCSTKKLPIRGMEEDWDVVMDTTLVAEKVLSWKDRLVGMGLRADERTTTSNGLDGVEEFRLLEEDVERSLVNVANLTGNRGMIGKVAKFDFNTDNSVRGRFARIAVFINLDRDLITQVLEATGPEEFGIGITGNRGEQRQISKENKEVAAPNPGTYRPWMLAKSWGRRFAGSCGWVKSGPRPRSFRPFSVEPKRGRRPFTHKSKLAAKGWVKLGYPNSGQSLDRRSRTITTGHLIEFSSAQGSVKANGSRKGKKLKKVIKKKFQRGLVNEVPKVMDEKSGEQVRAEPKVSGHKADEIIAKLRLHYSYRVEARGFLRGIWIGWKNLNKEKTAMGSIKRDYTYHHCPLDGNGPSFTWQREGVFERLDRELSNAYWIQTFPKCLVTHLFRIKSDHQPLLIDLCLEFNVAKGRPFQFLAGWAQHQSISSTISKLWEYNGDMSNTLGKLTVGLKKWNKKI